MRRHSRKIIAAGACLALLVGLLGTAVAAGKPPASNDQPAFTVLKVVHRVFRGVRHQVRRLGFAVEKLGFAVAELQGEFIDLDAKVDDLEVEVLSQRVEDLEKMVLALQFGIDDLVDLAALLPPIADFNDQLRGCIRIFDGDIGGLPGPHVLFEACNVHVRSGTLATDGPVNGSGNLLIGYNEARCGSDLDIPPSCDGPGGNPDFLCPEGLECLEDDEVCVFPGTETRPDQVTCIADNECPGEITCAHSIRSGSHNLVVGDGHGYTSYGGVVAGQFNRIGAEHTSIVGGRRNSALGPHSAVGGGVGNIAEGSHSSISGGAGNAALGETSSVSGGTSNRTEGRSSSVSGGFRNVASSFGASVSGGFENVASDLNASVSGGANNVASGPASSISGGQDRTVSGDHDWRAGGAFEDD